MYINFDLETKDPLALVFFYLFSIYGDICMYGLLINC